MTPPRNKFLGSGTYGCVFNPPLTCSDPKKHSALSSRQENVGKIYFHDGDFEEEKRLLQHVTHDIDPHGEFTVKFLGDCTTQPTERDLVGASEDCRRMNGFRAKQVVYPDGGLDLKLYYTRHKQKPFKFFALWKPLMTVFKGLGVLHQKGLIHNDIKPANMLYSVKAGKVVMIDYGMMTTYKKAYREYNGTNDATYMYYPPDYRIVNRIIQTSGSAVPTLSSLMEFYEQSFSPLDVSAFFAEFAIDLRKDLVNVLDVFNQQQQRQHHTPKTDKSGKSHSLQSKTPTPLQRYKAHGFDAMLSKIDVYSLGISLAYMMHQMGLCEPDKLKKLTAAHRIKLVALKGLIYHMIRPNVFERWDTEKVVAAAIDLLEI